MFKLKVAESRPLRFKVSGGESYRWEYDEYIKIITSEYPDYEGAYAADARFFEQVFPTNQRVMHDDFTVHAINYTEAPNQYGTTVTIGG